MPRRNNPTKTPTPAPKRMTSYRQRMRAAGLWPVKCRRQALAVAASDPAGDEIMRFVAGVYEWPEP
jgi:hypothetical protein